jgi:hypothetical protein
MKRKIFNILPIIFIAFLSACGSAPTPAISAADIQNTAIAQAWAMVTLTQAALPTSTSTPTTMPPTETLMPTLMPVPTFPSLAPVVPAGSPTFNPCSDVAPKKPNGITVRVKFINKAEAPLDLHFGMQTANALGECGIYYFSLSKYDNPVVTVLAGCYWAYAYIGGSKPSNSKNMQWLCVTDPTREPDIWIGKETIGFH